MVTNFFNAKIISVPDQTVEPQNLPDQTNDPPLVPAQPNGPSTPAHGGKQWVVQILNQIAVLAEQVIPGHRQFISNFTYLYLPQQVKGTSNCLAEFEKTLKLPLNFF